MSTLYERIRFRWDHRWAPERLSAYLDGELPAGGRDRMERHVGACRDCHRLLDGLRATIDALHRAPGYGRELDAVQLAASVRVRLRRPV